MNSTSAYSSNRTKLIDELHNEQKRPLDEAVEMAQRLFDRIIFIAFCEDRQLLPEGTIREAVRRGRLPRRVTNPRWQSFKSLFRFIDIGQQHARHPQVQRRAVRVARGR